MNNMTANGSTGNAVIQTQNLTKQYGNFTALSDLSLTVNQGEIFGYLGPNGAGKTTTIRTLLDLIRPSAGKATIFGMDSHDDSVELHRRIGFLPGELSLWKNLTGQQVVNYVASVRGDDGAISRHAREIADRLTLDLTKRVRAYSSGNKRKLGLVLAMMHQPDLLILDEPTGGLDPLLQQTFNQMMLDYKAQGKTVFLSSHVLAEVQAICDRVGILRGGELKAVERVDDLTHREFAWITIRFRDMVTPDTVAHLPNVQNVSTDGEALKFQLLGDWNPLLDTLRDQYIVSIETKEPSLEEIFLTFYGEGEPVTQRDTHAEAEAV